MYTTFSLQILSTVLLTLAMPTLESPAHPSLDAIYIEGEGMMQPTVDFSFGEHIQYFDIQTIVKNALLSFQNKQIAQGVILAETVSPIATNVPITYSTIETPWVPQNVTTSAHTSTPTVPAKNINTTTSTDIKELSKGKTLQQLVSSLTIRDEADVLAPSQEENIEETLADMFQKFPTTFYSSLSFLTLKTAKDGPRGLAGSNTMILRVSDMPKSEMVGVAIHELGHVVDLGHLKGTSSMASNFMDGPTAIPADDVSTRFYALSWLNSKEKRTASNEEFVSGYALSDPFEDFAETFNYYVLHGSEFKTLAQGNAVLAKKYDFMKTEVFANKEYTQGKSLGTYTSARPWDTTILPYSWEWYKNANFK